MIWTHTFPEGNKPPLPFVVHITLCGYRVPQSNVDAACFTERLGGGVIVWRGCLQKHSETYTQRCTGTSPYHDVHACYFEQNYIFKKNCELQYMIWTHTFPEGNKPPLHFVVHITLCGYRVPQSNVDAACFTERLGGGGCYCLEGLFTKTQWNLHTTMYGDITIPRCTCLLFWIKLFKKQQLWIAVYDMNSHISWRQQATPSLCCAHHLVWLSGTTE